jgi:hypothetical protein
MEKKRLYLSITLIAILVVIISYWLYFTSSYGIVMSPIQGDHPKDWDLQFYVIENKKYPWVKWEPYDLKSKIYYKDQELETIAISYDIVYSKILSPYVIYSIKVGLPSLDVSLIEKIELYSQNKLVAQADTDIILVDSEKNINSSVRLWADLQDDKAIIQIENAGNVAYSVERINFYWLDTENSSSWSVKQYTEGSDITREEKKGLAKSPLKLPFRIEPRTTYEITRELTDTEKQRIEDGVSYIYPSLFVNENQLISQNSLVRKSPRRLLKIMRLSK